MSVLKYSLQVLALMSAFTIVNDVYANVANEPAKLVEYRPASFANIVNKVSPAVVNISTTQKVEVKNPLDDFKMDLPEGGQYDFFREFLDREFGGGGEGRMKKATSLGSGFLIDSTGYIVTNNHVIAEADEVNVTLSDNAEKIYKAKVMGKDPKTDLALIKIEGPAAFPFLQFGDSEKSNVGDWIIAVGNPFGLGGTVTAGIISAKARSIPMQGSGQLDEFIQTDASINRGNSGGPMINMEGEVIGVNSVIISPSGGNVGIGFSIPSNQIKPIIEQLREKGSIIRGWLGVKIQLVSEDIAKHLDLPDAKGALVSEVTKDSPSEKAGVKVGDVILKFDGQVVNSMQKLPRLVAETPVNKNVKIEVMRDGKLLTLEARIQKMETESAEEVAQKEESDNKASPDNPDIIGMRLDTLNASNRTKYRIDKAVSGVLVAKVARGSIARDAGIKPGDVIIKFNKIKIEATADLQKAVAEAKKAGLKNAVFLVHREGNNFFVVLDLE